ncbi:hypothetical protein Tco_1575774 [Tanacetum coccineum]
MLATVPAKEGFEVVEGLKFQEGYPRCSQAKGSKVKERLVQLRMEVRFEVLIEKKKMYYLGLRRFDLWMEFLMVHLEELGLRKFSWKGFEEEDWWNSWLGVWIEEDEDDKRNKKEGLI